MTLQEFIAQYPIHIESRIEWGDMDAYTHVNNTMFFRYFERVRMLFAEHIGFLAWREQHGIGPILASTQCRFRAPLKYPDTITIGTRISELQADRFLMQYAIYSHALQDIAAQGDGWLVSYDYNRGMKTELPEVMREKLQASMFDGLGL